MLRRLIETMIIKVYVDNEIQDRVKKMVSFFH